MVASSFSLLPALKEGVFVWHLSYESKLSVQPLQRNISMLLLLIGWVLTFLTALPATDALIVWSNWRRLSTVPFVTPVILGRGQPGRG